MLRRSVLFVVVALVLGALPTVGGRVPARAQEAAAGNRDVIVVLAPRVEPGEVTRRLGIDPTFVYRDVFPGFAARLSAETERALTRLPGAALVNPHDARSDIPFGRDSARRRRGPRPAAAQGCKKRV